MKYQAHLENGFVLISTFFLLTALAALLGAYFTITNIELATTKYSKDSTTGFYAAEAGLNLRAQAVRQIFIGYNRPSGTSPTPGPDVCTGGNQGTGDFACTTYTFNDRQVLTYITEDGDNPYNNPVPAGDRYEGLDMQEYRYTVRSEARNSAGRTEAILELRFKSRLVPMFQFVAFYDKDLEVLPGPTMNLSGPIHTNGDLYLNAGNELNISGQVTSVGDLYRGRKNDSSCSSNDVTVLDPVSARAIYPSCSTRTLVSEAYLADWNGMVQTGVSPVSVPAPAAFEAAAGGEYWDNSDIRVMLKLDASDNPDFSESVTAVEIQNVDGSVDEEATDNLNTCAGQIENIPGGQPGSFYPVGTSNSFQNHREGALIRMLEVDVRGLFDCIYNINQSAGDGFLLGGKLLSDDTEGGLVIYLGIDGPNDTTINNYYAVRIRNHDELQSSIGIAPDVIGTTFVSDQAFYTSGNFNSVNKIPAAILADTFNPLSENWNFSDPSSFGSRNASNTTFNGAILAGTDVTGGVEGSGGQDSGSYNGGFENYPRFSENWSGDTFTYRGSLCDPRPTEVLHRELVLRQSGLHRAWPKLGLRHRF